jgi:uncharacterized membrane protein YsdA (DUF1294 family)
MKRSHLVYPILGVGLALLLHISLQERLTVHWYPTWIGSCSIVTWAFYAWDKRVSEIQGLFKRALGNSRIPEWTLNMMALLGGFFGGWVGRAMFDHKTNAKKHPLILAVLIFSTLFHILFVMRLIYGPPLDLWPPSNWLTM